MGTFMILLAPVSLAAPVPTEWEGLASLLPPMNGPALVLVRGEPLASFVPEVVVATGPADEIDRLLHAGSVRQCYATALGQRPAWLAVATIALDVEPSGEIVAKIYSVRARPGLEADWTAVPGFEGCLGAALGAAKVPPRAAAEHWTLEATFRPAVELSSAPEYEMRFGQP